MPLQLGDNNDIVLRWRHVMAAMFAGYAHRIDPDTGQLIGVLAPMTQFGARAAAWAREYQRNTGQPVTGVVSDHDLATLKIVLPYRPIHIYTAPGSGAPWWVGPAFDTGEWAKHVLNINHQPVNYPIGGYMGLMGGDPANSYVDIITDLDRELERLLDANPDVHKAMAARASDPHAPVDVELWFAAYSQSADGMKCSVNRLLGDGTGPTPEGPPSGVPGKYAVLRDRINGLLLFGDPSRQPGPTKVGNNPAGWGIARKVFAPWLNDLTWSITVETPALDFYAADDDSIRPLFYEWFVQAKTSIGFAVYCGQIIIPALLNLVAPFLGTGTAALANPLATSVLAGAAGVPPNLIGSLIGGISGSDVAPDPKLIEFLSVQGVLTNLPQLFKLLADLQGIMAHGDYYTPRAEFGGRSGPQVACDVMAGFRR